MYGLIVAVGMLAYTNVGWAVEPTNIDERFALIGVISESSNGQKGVAVLRDEVSHKTYTLRIGDRIPVEGNYVLRSVSKHTVSIDDGISRKNITYSGKADYEDDKAKDDTYDPTSLFLRSDDRDDDEEGEQLQTLFNRYYGNSELQPPVRIWLPETKENREAREDREDEQRYNLVDDEDDSEITVKEINTRDAVELRPSAKVLQNTSLLDRPQRDGDLTFRSNPTTSDSPGTIESRD